MKAQRARAQQSQHAYVRTLQNAFREVEDSLVGVQTYRSEHAARRRQVDAAANTLRLSEARYDGGVVDYLEVLDSERTLFDAQLEESSTRRLALVAFVTLYKALGGGWSPEDEDAEGEGAGWGGCRRRGEPSGRAHRVRGPVGVSPGRPASPEAKRDGFLSATGVARL